jgi:hypothetical protein
VFGGTTALDPVAADVDGWNLFGLTAAEQLLMPDQERPHELEIALPPPCTSPPSSLDLLSEVSSEHEDRVVVDHHCRRNFSVLGVSMLVSQLSGKVCRKDTQTRGVRVIQVGGCEGRAKLCQVVAVSSGVGAN